MDFEKEQLGEWGIPSFPLGEVARNASRLPRGLEQECEASLCGAPSALKQGIQRGLGFYPAEALENEPYLAQAMMGIDVDNNVYSAQVPTTSVYENDIWYEK